MGRTAIFNLTGDKVKNLKRHNSERNGHTPAKFWLFSSLVKFFQLTKNKENPRGKYTITCIDAKSPAFGWRLQLSDSSSPAEQAKSPAELGLTNFVIHISCKLLFHKRKTVHDLRNREIY